MENHAVLFANAIQVINDLSDAQKNGRFKIQLKKYLAPQLLILDEVGYLPIDQRGADLLFQVINPTFATGSDFQLFLAGSGMGLRGKTG
jgi:DNA replication protein DnaC